MGIISPLGSERYQLAKGAVACLGRQAPRVRRKHMSFPQGLYVTTISRKSQEEIQTFLYLFYRS